MSKEFYKSIEKKFHEKVNLIAKDVPYFSNYAEAFEQYIINCPEIFQPNVRQWISSEPLSDIKYNGISIKDVLEKESLPDYYFLQVLKNFIEFYNSKSQNQRLCFRMLPGWDVV